jgi:hypothetical protein
MNIAQHLWTTEGGWDTGLATPQAPADLVLAFGAPKALGSPDALDELHRAYPTASIVGCSTSGEIAGTRVHDDTIAATAVGFSHSRVAAVTVELSDVDGDSGGAGARLGAALDPAGLRHVLVFSDGLAVNGSELTRGLADALPTGVEATGGLAGDGARFARTLVVADGRAAPGRVVAVGFYGERLRMGLGTMGGWDAFGPDRLITRAEGNVLHELDGTSALTLYKSYLGTHAANLPASALLFPLSVRRSEDETGTVRTVLAVDDAAHTMTFAGDVPVGCYARLMRANFDRLIDGATGAARATYERLGDRPPELALLISCVGRKLVLDQRIEEEVEGIHDVFGPGAALAGFYSYGEISPMTPGARCELHNQTMTITTISED